MSEAALQRCFHNGALKICNKSTEEHPYQSVDFNKVIVKKYEIILRCGCSLVTLLHIFKRHVLKIIFGGLLLFRFQTYIALIPGFILYF